MILHTIVMFTNPFLAIVTNVRLIPAYHLNVKDKRD